MKSRGAMLASSSPFDAAAPGVVRCVHLHSRVRRQGRTRSASVACPSFEGNGSVTTLAHRRPEVLGSPVAGHSIGDASTHRSRKGCEMNASSTLLGGYIAANLTRPSAPETGQHVRGFGRPTAAREDRLVSGRTR